MIQKANKALVGLVMGILFLLTSFGVTVPGWANETAITTVVAALTPILVYFVPNKDG